MMEMSQNTDTTAAATSRDRFLNQTIMTTGGAAVGSLLVLLLLTAVGQADRVTISATLLIAALSLSVGFIAHGIRAIRRQQGSPIVSFVLVAIWIAFAVVQIVRLVG